MQLVKPAVVFALLALLPIESHARTLKVASTNLFEAEVGDRVVACAEVGTRFIPGKISPNGRKFTSFAVQVKRLTKKMKKAATTRKAKRLRKKRADLRALQRDGVRECANGPSTDGSRGGEKGGSEETLRPNPGTPSNGETTIAPIVACPGFESVGIYSVPNYAGEEVCPGPDAQILYVSSSEGSDSNDGLSPERPLRSFARARSFLRHGRVDWIVAKRGDRFGEPFGLWGSGGADASNPDVFTAYGDIALERPLLEPWGAEDTIGVKMWPTDDAESLDFVTISGIHLRNEHEIGGIGVRLLGSSSHIVLHDMRISRFTVGIVVQGLRDGDRHVNIAVLGSTIDENAPVTGGGHSQGMFATNVCGLILRDNNVLNNGYITRDHPTAGATTYNQGLYFQAGSCEVEDFRRNHVRGNAAAGVQFRSGVKLAEANLFSRNSTQIVIANGTLPEYQGNRSIIRRNVLVEGAYLGSADRPGNLPKVGMYLRGGLFEAYENLSSDMIKHIEGSLCDSSYRRGACNMHYKSNYFVNGRAHRETTLLARIASSSFVHADFIGAVFTDNFVFMPHMAPTSTPTDSGPDMFFHFNGAEATQSMGDWDLEIARNLYVNGYAADGSADIFRIGNTKANMTEWRRGHDSGLPAVEPTAMTMAQVQLKDPCRTIATYVDDIIDGNTRNNNCAIMNDDNLYKRFDEELVKLNRFSDPRLLKLYSAVSVVNYIRDGLSLPPVSGEQGRE